MADKGTRGEGDKLFSKEEMKKISSDKQLNKDKVYVGFGEDTSHDDSERYYVGVHCSGAKLYVMKPPTDGSTLIRAEDTVDLVDWKKYRAAGFGVKLMSEDPKNIDYKEGHGCHKVGGKIYDGKQKKP